MTKPTRRHFLELSASGLLAGPLWSGLPAKSRSCQPAASSDEGPIASIRYLGNQFLENEVDVTGADGATSTPLPANESLWVFGDTVTGPFESIHGLDLAPLCSNTGAIVPAQNVAQGIRRFRFLSTPDGKRPRQLVPFAPDEDPARHRIWAMHGVCIGSRIYLFYHRITLLKDVDVFTNFKLDGMGIARAEVGEYRFTRLTAPDGTREFWKGGEPGFGVFVERANDYIYLWGSLATGMHLARTRPESLEDLGSYEYLVDAPTEGRPNAMPRWSKEFASTAKLFDSVPNEMSAAYNPHIRKYLAFHSLHRENKIVMRWAPQITGPWNKAQVIYRPERINDTDSFYAVKEHRELARDGGRVLYVTFVNSGTYVPQMIELTLK